MENALRLALCTRLLKKANIDLPVEALRNEQILDLEAQIGISAKTLNRLFAKKGYNDCQNICGRQGTQTAICQFLDCESWELLMLELACLTDPKGMAKKHLALQSRQ